MYRFTKGLVLSCSSVALALTVCSPAFAQEQASDTEATADSRDIIVTAQRRQQNLQDVPMAISAYSGDMIQKMGAANLAQVFAATPSVRYQTPAGNSGFPVFNIRGVTLLDFSYANEASVAVYADEIYLGNPAFATQQLFDVERVEILRGPQGTLYGRNATGGLVNFISRRPTDTFQGTAMAQYSSFNDVVLEGAVSGPASDRLRVRVAGRFNRNDGWQKNLVTGTRLASVDHAIGLRGTLEYDVSDAAKLTVSGHYSAVEGSEDARAFYGTKQGPGTAAPLCAFSDILASRCVNAAGFRDPDPDPRHVYSDLRKIPYDMQSAGGFARLEVDLGGATLTAISSYDWGRKYDAVDSDAAALSVSNLLTSYYIRHRQTTHELRLGGDTGALTWLVGGYYYHDYRFFTSELTGSKIGNIAKQSIDSVSAFGQATFAVTSQLNVTAGLRYTSDRKNLRELAFVSNPSPSTEQGTSLGQGFPFRGKLTPNKVTWQAGIDYHPTDEVMLFAKVSTGFKTGGYNTAIVTSITAVGPVDNETITAYEGGIKTRFLDKALTFNLTGFYYDYKGIQASASVPSCTGCLTQTIVYLNIGNAKIKGFEAELAYNPNRDLSASLSLSYNYNKLKSPPTVLVAGTPLNGKRLVNTPRLALSGNFAWEPSLGEGNGNLITGADFSYQSQVFLGVDNHPLKRQGAYAVVGARLGWRTPGGTRIEAYSRNLFDKHYFTARTFLTDVAPGTWAMPRQIGLRVTTSF